MFLPFGTIAPGLLLPLLAFAYMLLFGSHALTKTAGDYRTGNPEVRIFTEPGESSLSGATPVFTGPTDDITDPFLADTDDWRSVDRHLCMVIKIPPEDIVPDTHLLSCFARPPPAAAMA